MTSKLTEVAILITFIIGFFCILYYLFKGCTWIWHKLIYHGNCPH